MDEIILKAPQNVLLSFSSSYHIPTLISFHLLLQNALTHNPAVLNRYPPAK